MESTGPSRTTAIALAFMAVIWVSPFSWLFLNAFNPLSTGQLEIPRAVGLDNFAKLFAKLSIPTKTGAEMPLQSVRL